MNSRYEVKKMLADKVKLSAKEILEKEFKTGVRGYKQEEVDKFLDMVIKDYRHSTKKSKSFNKKTSICLNSLKPLSKGKDSLHSLIQQTLIF
ncbi:DivIVA domain-containing protein [Bacillus sp. SL00103]